ncbi:MAG TPA: Zn-dependent hydrolase [Clostridiaceae bacterium]|nr:Zn-dependent hydrolase [Clostridiaceae bacterium]
MNINKERLWNRIQELGLIGADPEGGVSRFAFSPEDKKASKLVMTWMKEAGLKVRVDAVGNIFGRIDGLAQGPVVLTGSHLDSVKNGGKFDGVAGVISALEVLQVMKENNKETKYPVEMVIFVNEEGSKFPGGLMGSMAIAGKLTREYLYNTKDSSVTTLREAIKQYGGHPDNFLDARRSPSELKAFLELHIEQAGFLEYKNMPVGVVSGIAGPYQMKLCLRGRTGHAGAAPMQGRRDPMVAAGMIIQEVEQSAIEAAFTTRGTIGYIKAFPGGHNIIPETVDLTIDYRDIDISSRTQAVDRIKKYISEVCKIRRLEHELEVTQDTPPVIINEKIVKLLDNTAKEHGIPTIIMPSGAAHDAMIMAELCNIGMIFVRSREGLSHCPKEFSSKEDLELATELLLHSIIKVADGLTDEV